MRDPKRIKKILRLIRKIWLKNPGLRLCQLIENCAKIIENSDNVYFHREDMYYIEDDILEKRLKKTYLMEEKSSDTITTNYQIL